MTASLQWTEPLAVRQRRFVGLSFLALGMAYEWLLRKKCIRYSVEAKGLRRRSGRGFILYRWRDVEGYRIVKHPWLSGVGVLEFKTRRFRRVHQWSFNASQLSEQELKRALERHLPQSSLRTF